MLVSVAAVEDRDARIVRCLRCGRGDLRWQRGPKPSREWRLADRWGQPHVCGQRLDPPVQRPYIVDDNDGGGYTEHRKRKRWTR